MNERETQQLVRDAITSLAFGVDPRDALIRIAEGVGIRVERDGEGHAFILPSDTIWIGDSVRLTGKNWGDFQLAGAVVIVADIGLDGEARFVDPTHGTLAIYRSDIADYSATPVPEEKDET